MTKNERIAALESRMTAVEQHCGIAPPADPAPATATLAVGDTVETLDYARFSGGEPVASGPDIGAIGTLMDTDSEICTGRPCRVVFPEGGAEGTRYYYPASSLRRVQPAPDVQPAAGYVAGQAVECDSLGGKVTGQFVCELDPGFYAVLIGNSPIPHRYRAAEIRPCPASAGSAVMDVQTGEYKIYDGRIVRWPCPAPGANYTEPFDPTRHAVMLVPRQPAAPRNQHEDQADALARAVESRQPAEQPAATAYCPKCHHALGQADKHGCKCAAPAEQPAARVPSPTCGTCHGRWNHCPDCTPAEQPDPAAQSMAQRILAILDEGYHEYDEMEHALRAAAAVAPADPPHIETLPGYAKGYNAGQNSILAPMLAALKGDTHEQR